MLTNPARLFISEFPKTLQERKVSVGLSYWLSTQPFHIHCHCQGLFQAGAFLTISRSHGDLRDFSGASGLGREKENQGCSPPSKLEKLYCSCHVHSWNRLPPEIHMAPSSFHWGLFPNVAFSERLFPYHSGHHTIPSPAPTSRRSLSSNLMFVLFMALTRAENHTALGCWSATCEIWAALEPVSPKRHQDSAEFSIIFSCIEKHGTSQAQINICMWISKYSILRLCLRLHC